MRRMPKMDLGGNAVDEVKALSLYVQGFAAALGESHPAQEKLSDAAEWLDKLSDHMCGQGYVGCEGGRECGSDHK